MPKVKIEETENIRLSKTIKEILNPDYVYIPFNSNANLHIKSNEYVKKGSILFDDNKIPTYSPISGKVIGSCKVLSDNKLKDAIAIENDFEEKNLKRKTYKNKSYTKEELINKLSELNLNYNLKGNTLIINGIDYEPYEYSLSYITKNYTESILDTIDELISILNIKKCYLAIKNDDTDNVQTLINQIGTYPSINLRLIDNYYPNANKQIIIKNFKLDEKNTIYLNVEDIYNIYNAIKKDEPIYDKFITITGNLLNKGRVLKVKLGTRILDIIDNNSVLNSNYHIIINGLLSGYEIKNKNAIITSNIRSIFICKDNKIEQNSCINCGLCHINCPVNADPRTGYNLNECIKCGLCNYLCPSKIQLIGDKNE